MVARVQFSDADRINDLHWRLAHATIEAMRARVDSQLRKQGLRIREDREDIISEALPKLKRAFDATCPLSETGLISGRPQLVCAETILPRVSSLVWKILEQARCDFLRRPANRLKIAGSSCAEYLAAYAKPASIDVSGLFESPHLDGMDHRIVELLLDGEDQKTIACIIGVDPSTISRRLGRIRQAIAEN